MSSIRRCVVSSAFPGGGIAGEIKLCHRANGLDWHCAAPAPATAAAVVAEGLPGELIERNRIVVTRRRGGGEGGGGGGALAAGSLAACHCVSTPPQNMRFANSTPNWVNQYQWQLQRKRSTEYS